MVRLELCRKWHKQYGFHISIPKWYDWSYSIPDRFRLSWRISIPKWYDWSNRLGYKSFSKDFISIPKWYDWSIRLVSGVAQVLLFQFLNGTIGVQTFLFATNLFKLFQFLNGTIGVSSAYLLYSFRVYFNS